MGLQGLQEKKGKSSEVIWMTSETLLRCCSDLLPAAIDITGGQPDTIKSFYKKTKRKKKKKNLGLGLHRDPVMLVIRFSSPKEESDVALQHDANSTLHNVTRYDSSFTNSGR